MAQTLKLKRSAVAGRVPTTSDLQLGELGLNTYDGKLYTRRDNGSVSIVELSGGAGGGSAGLIVEFAYIISETVSLGANRNGLSVGNVEITAGHSVTVPANAFWVIL